MWYLLYHITISADNRDKEMQMAFHDFFKSLRQAKGLTLRQFCLDSGYDTANISKLERGLMKPPSDEDKLRKLAKALGIKKGSEEYNTFFNLAAAARKTFKITKLTTEEVLAKLPVLFRAVDREDLTEKDLDAMIEVVRKAHQAEDEEL